MPQLKPETRIDVTIVRELFSQCRSAKEIDEAYQHVVEKLNQQQRADQIAYEQCVALQGSEERALKERELAASGELLAALNVGGELHKQILGCTNSVQQAGEISIPTSDSCSDEPEIELATLPASVNVEGEGYVSRTPRPSIMRGVALGDESAPIDSAEKDIGLGAWPGDVSRILNNEGYSDEMISPTPPPLRKSAGRDPIASASAPAQMPPARLTYPSFLSEMVLHSPLLVSGVLGLVMAGLILVCASVSAVSFGSGALAMVSFGAGLATAAASYGIFSSKKNEQTVRPTPPMPMASSSLDNSQLSDFGRSTT